MDGCEQGNLQGKENWRSWGRIYPIEIRIRDILGEMVEGTDEGSIRPIYYTARLS